MFEKLKLWLAYLIIKKKYWKSSNHLVNFNGKISQSIDFLFIMPGNEHDFRNSLELVRYFLIHNKNITLILPEHRVNLIQEKEKYKFITYNMLDFSKLKLPVKTLIDKIRKQDYDVTIDLNYRENPFYIALTVLSKAGIKVGFSNEKTDLYLGLQFFHSSTNVEAVYRNFLNFLRMF